MHGPAGYGLVGGPGWGACAEDPSEADADADADASASYKHSVAAQPPAKRRACPQARADLEVGVPAFLWGGAAGTRQRV